MITGGIYGHLPIVVSKGRRFWHGLSSGGCLGREAADDWEGQGLCDVKEVAIRSLNAKRGRA